MLIEAYQFIKLMIETFKKTKYKSGKIVFLDGNKENYHIENLEYITKFDIIEKPNELDLIKILRFYFEIWKCYTEH